MIDLICGDALTVLRTLPAGSVDCCISSPPYYGLRNYGDPAQIGLELTPADYVAALVAVFAEVRRVLKADGTVWLNLGDSYAAGKTGRADGDRPRIEEGFHGNPAYKGQESSQRPVPPGLKPKDLIGIPWRVAFALQADGWYLRSDIIWSKPNPMPESVRDRPTKSHEYLFLLSRQERYWYDAAAIAERSISNPREREKFNGESVVDTKLRGRDSCCGVTPAGRNRRSVWTVTPKPFKGAHFAVMPQRLVEPCILAGCRPGGTVLDPFLGSGTVAVVAKKLGRSAIGIDLNEKYLNMARKRLAAITPPLPLVFETAGEPI